MTRDDGRLARRRNLVDAFAHLAFVRALDQQPGRELGEELDALQLTHEGMPQTGCKLAQHDVTDAVRVPARRIDHDRAWPLHDSPSNCLRNCSSASGSIGFTRW